MPIIRGFCSLVLVGFFVVAPSAQSEGTDRVRVYLSTGENRCNDSLDEWETWLKRIIAENCSLPVDTVSIVQGGSLSPPIDKDDLTQSTLPRGTLDIALLLKVEYESAIPLCMASLSASASYTNEEGQTALFAPVTTLAWNAESARELMGWMEEAIIEYSKSACDVIQD